MVNGFFPAPARSGHIEKSSLKKQHLKACKGPQTEADKWAQRMGTAANLRLKNAKPAASVLMLIGRIGRGEWIRNTDLLVPNLETPDFARLRTGLRLLLSRVNPTCYQ